MNIIEQLPGYVGWKDTRFRHLGCNRQLASVMKLKHPEHIIGMLDDDLPGGTEEIVNFHRKNDELVLSGKTVTVLHRSSAPYDGSLFYSIKKPLLDSDEIVGIIYQCHEYKTDNSHFKSDANPYRLSTRELETLFCMLNGMTAKQIAELMHLSKRTIETYVDNIKNKFGCSNKSEMLVHGLKAGYMNHVPQRFLGSAFCASLT